MTPTVLYRIFKDILPAMSAYAKSYIKNKHADNSILIRMEGGDELIFTYKGPDNWALQTVKYGGI